MMLYTKIQAQSLLSSGEDFQEFLPYMGMAAILINGPWPFEQIFNSSLTEGSIWSLKKIGPGVSEEKSFKGVDDGRTMTDGKVTIAHPEPCSGELIKHNKWLYMIN